MIFEPEVLNITVSESEWEDSHKKPLLPLNIFFILQGPIIVIGLLANAFLLFLFIVSPRLRTPSNILLLQRAIADILIQLLYPFMMYFINVGFSELGLYVCKFYNVSIHIGHVASTVFLMGAAIYNYQASNPERFTRHYRITTIRIVSILAWVLAIAAGLAAVFFSYSKKYCYLAPLYEHKLFGIYSIVHVSIMFIIPLIVTWVFVGRTQFPSPSGDEEESTSEGHAKDILDPRLMVGLATVFTAFSGIYWLVHVLIIGVLLNETPNTSRISSSFAIFIEAFNGILVLYLSKEMRQEVIVRLLPSRFRRSDTFPLQ